MTSRSDFFENLLLLYIIREKDIKKSWIIYILDWFYFAEQKIFVYKKDTLYKVLTINIVKQIVSVSLWAKYGTIHLRLFGIIDK